MLYFFDGSAIMVSTETEEVMNDNDRMEVFTDVLTAYHRFEVVAEDQLPIIVDLGGDDIDVFLTVIVETTGWRFSHGERD